jgi:hypothetical protein
MDCAFARRASKSTNAKGGDTDSKIASYLERSAPRSIFVGTLGAMVSVALTPAERTS